MGRIAGVLAAALLGFLAARSGWAEEGLSAEDGRDIAWFEGTGHPTGDGLPLVRLVRTSKDQRGTFQSIGCLGFLVKETDERWLMSGAELESGSVAKRCRDDETRTVERIDTATFARAFQRGIERGGSMEMTRGFPS